MSILLRTVRALMLAVPFCLAGPAQAAPISFSFSGSWERVDPLLTSQFSVGQAFSGSFTDESSAAPIGDANSAFYSAVTDFSVTTGSYTATLSSPSGAATSISLSTFGLREEMLVGLTATDGLTGPPVEGVLPSFAIMLLVNFSDGGPFDSAIPLPTSFRLSDFDGNQFFLSFHTGISIHNVFGTLSTLTPEPTIPEPTALALYAVGGGIFALFRPRKRAAQKSDRSSLSAYGVPRHPDAVP